MANYTVSKNKENDKWGIKKDGASKISGYAETQKQADRQAKEFSKNSGGGEVRIKGLDGKFRDSDTVAPAKDPFPPRDKKH